MNFLYNKKNFYHNDDEFETYILEKYNPLIFKKNIGNLEREVRLIREMSKELFQNNCDLFSIGSSNSGFIPIMSNKSFKNIHIIDIDEKHLNNLKKNIENIDNIYLNSNLEIKPSIIRIDENKEIDIKDYQESIIISYTKLFPNSFKLKNSLVHIYIPDSLLDQFKNSFDYCFKNGEFDYNNLIEYVMIIKNGGDTLKRVLEENKQYIDRWTILDTGSTDGTQNVISEVMRNKKGKMYERTFDNFRDSRNLCLDLSSKMCKFTIMLDDTYVIKNNLLNFLKEINDDIYADSYSFIINSDDVEYSSNRMVKTDLNLRFENKIHEVFEKNLCVLVPKENAYIFDIQTNFMHNRTKERKLFDLGILLEMVEEEPENPRHLYYVAQTYIELGNFEKAVEYFIRRVEHKNVGHKLEKMDAYFELARTLNFRMNRPFEEVEQYYLKSYELDKTRADSLYYIGLNYNEKGDFEKAYHYFSVGFEIGYDINSQYSLKPNICFYYIPLYLANLCYIYKDYQLGVRCCLRFLENNKSDANNYNIMMSWYKIFLILRNKKMGNVIRESKDKICFVADGGFEKWTGSDINKKGIGGSETYIIEMARAMKNNSNYDVYVLCNCENWENFEGVNYIPLTQIYDFFSSNYIKHCFVSRFLEYYPFVIESHVENVYILFHDLIQEGSIIPLSNKLKKIFCLTEWHVQHVRHYFPVLCEKIESFNYGINREQFLLNGGKEPYRFIYTSFPNRGLLPLLRMWPKILEHYPVAELHIYVDLDGKWVREFHREEMGMIKDILGESRSVYNHGWVSKRELAEAWSRADVWFYPCKFYETFCLTALEAALSRTFAITNCLGALNETVGDRGLRLEGDVSSEEWQENAVREVVRVLGDRSEMERYVDKNYEWALGLSWDERGRRMLEVIGKYDFEYLGMYNWTNDIPKGSREVFLDVIRYFNGKGVKNPQILEIGSYAGISLIEILRNIPDSVGYALDCWKSYDENDLLKNLEGMGVEGAFERNVRKAGLEKSVVKVKSDSQEKLVEYYRDWKKFDFIYVDGSHKAIDAYVDSFLSWKILNVGGIMVIDDYLMRGEMFDVPLKGVDHFMERLEGSYKILHRGYRIFLEKIR